MSNHTGLHHVAFYPSDWLAGTRGMSAVETGVYITIVSMLYERGEALEMDNKRLARLCGTTPKTFEKTISFLISEGKLKLVQGGLWNTRVEKELKKAREKSDSASDSAKKRWEKTQQNQASGNADAVRSQCDGYANQNQNQTYGGGGGDAGAQAREAEPPPEPEPETFREKLLAACGADPVSGMTGRGGSQLGLPDQMIEAQRWLTDLGLTEGEVISEISRVAEGKRDGPPSSLKYFTTPMERLAGNLSEARSKPMTPQHLTPIQGGRDDRRSERQRASAALDETIRRVGTGEVRLGSGEWNPW